MKRKSKRPHRQQIGKGAPSGLIMSLLFHGVAFFVAGLFVVFRVINSPEPEFVAPPPIERPRMKLKKPRVKVKKSSNPKPSSRIVAKVKTAKMPEIQLPDLLGSGDGLLGDGTGLGKIDIEIPDLNSIKLIGSDTTTGSDLVGTYYDFNRRSNGRKWAIDRTEFREALVAFANAGWDLSKLSRYYRSDKKLYSSFVMVPEIPSQLGPEAFGEPEAAGYFWAVHYKGQLVHKDGITFRFRAFGDDQLLIRVDGELVLVGGWANSQTYLRCGWSSSSGESRNYKLGSGTAEVGDWITLEPGVPLDIEILVAEDPGGEFCAQVLVEEKGVEYERNHKGGPILPVFTTDPLSREMLDTLYEHVVVGEASLAGGPVFCDYVTSWEAPQEAPQDHASQPAAHSDQEEFRTWTLVSGKRFEGQYVRAAFETVRILGRDGEILKIPEERLSSADRGYVELRNPPKLDLNFLHRSKNRLNYYPEGSIMASKLPPSVFDHTFGVRVRRLDAVAYSKPLQIEYYAIGRQRYDQSKYILLEHKKQEFRPSEQREMEFEGSIVRLRRYVLNLQNRGHKYAHHLVVATDERGVVVAHAASADWLFEHYEKLKKLPAGAFLDKNCNRVYPTGPDPDY